MRIRYRIGVERFSVTVEGTKAAAQMRLRELLKSGDDGTHTAPSRMTVAQWISHWISVGAPGKNKKRNGGRTIEGYAEALRVYVVPAIGKKPVQKLSGVDIDKLYVALEEKLGGTSRLHVHRILKACLGAAVRAGLIATNPADRVETVPTASEFTYEPLDQEQLRAIIRGFRPFDTLFPLVCVLALTGCRRNEALALRVSDLDPIKKTLRIERALEVTRRHGVRFKGPKRESHKRTIAVDDELVAVLSAQIDKPKQLVAGIPDNDGTPSRSSSCRRARCCSLRCRRRASGSTS